ncbi:hypothetical protein M3580_03370 [Bacillus safensis]|uniref:hypothetical protein n=1 Tax=Bacillus safensis TaxID=561879 RepID=UPI002040A864|nr:hypothetical protein [Bacillus safensis]MCM2988275.1 hypothetical protein [Bacillus safensis]
MAFEKNLIPVNTMGVKDEETGEWVPVDAVGLKSHTRRITVDDILHMHSDNDQKIADLKEKVESLLTDKDENIIYVDILSTDSNDGLTEQTPVKTFKKALDILNKMGSKTSFGSWTIKIKGYGDQYTYPAVRIRDMPYFTQSFKIIGDTDSNGNPFTVFKKDSEQNGSNHIGLWIEPGVRSLYCKNLHFKNFKNGFNGYGFIMKNQVYALLENCHATDCDCGFAGVNIVTLTALRCIATNCTDVGFKSLYSSNATFGSGTGGSLYNDGGNGCKAIGCNRGVFVSRNSVAHVDYMNIEDSGYAGVHIDIASRVAVLGSHFKRNDFGVKTEGASEWNNNPIEPNFFYMDDNNNKNRVAFGHFGASREVRMYSQNATNEFRVSVKSSDVIKKGNDREVIWRSSELGKIPAYWFVSPAKRIRIVINGTNEGSANKILSMYTTTSDSTKSALLASSTINKKGAFIAEHTIYPQGVDSQKHIANIQYAYDIPRMGVFSRSVSTDIDRYFLLTAEMSDSTSSDKLTIHSLEIYFVG